MSVQGLTPEQLYDSLAQATGTVSALSAAAGFRDRQLAAGGIRRHVRRRGSREDGARDHDPAGAGVDERRGRDTSHDGHRYPRASVARVAYQPGMTIAAAGGGHTLTALTAAPFLDRAAKIETLYFAAPVPQAAP